MRGMRLFGFLLGLAVFLAISLSIFMPEEGQQPEPGKPPGRQAGGPLREIPIAYDPGKAALFEDLVNSFNSRAAVKVRATKLEIPQMLEAIPTEQFVAVSPDSALWVESIDRAWRDARGGDSSVIGTTIRYATTPVVLATWRGKEAELGGPEERGWGALLRRSSQDPSYRWSHGSPRASASGMLALIAEFYAGANKSYGLTKADADNEDVRRYVAQVERTIARYGGESDAALVDYLLKEGSNTLSATVMPEASVFDFNQRSRAAKLAAIAPAEGTLMLDHPLILLETAQLTPEERRAFLEFARFLTGPDGQAIVARHGFRPVDLAFDMSKSPLRGEGISTDQPKLLQMPSSGVVTYLRQAWATGLKRRANIMLVVDVSGSMEGDKLARTKEALAAFVKQIPSDEERVGLAVFSSDYREVVPLGRLGDVRQRLATEIDRLSASGNTAFYYAVWRAHTLLAQRNDPERINVVVAMTDGLENASGSFSGRNVPGVGSVPQITTSSGRDPGPLQRALERNGKGVMVFTVGYGGDADMNGLAALAGAFGGRSYRADPDTIKRLYELISQYF